MKNLMMAWLSGAVPAALGIALDMHRLKVNQVGLSPSGWTVVCVSASAFTVVPYLILRRRVWRKLIDAAWNFVGDNSHAIDVRRERLHALKRTGLICDSAFRACMRTLDAN
jgi:hypothetical protein